MKAPNDMPRSSKQPEMPPEDPILMGHAQKAEQLLETALQFIEENRYETYRNMEPAWVEAASGASFYLHRGYYCPSPVRDFLIGNCRRGKLLKRPTARSRISHRYIFGKDGLSVVQRFLDANQGYTEEYLLHLDSAIIGISMDSQGQLERISEEKYVDGKITEYIWVSCYQAGKVYRLSRGEYERYYYDDQGLAECDFHDISFGWNASVQCCRYRFTRANGYLESYIDVKKPGAVFTPGLKRLALPPFLVP